MTSRILFVTYVLMATWLVIAAGRRIALFLDAGQPLDWSPFASGTIGGIALLLLFLSAGERHQGRK